MVERMPKSTTSRDTQKVSHRSESNSLKKSRSSTSKNSSEISSTRSFTDDLKKSILASIKPSRKECDDLKSIIRTLTAELSEVLHELAIDAEVFVGGSAAKGTFLKGDFDVDVFVRFDSYYSSNTLSDILESALCRVSSIDSFERVHGSRDYFTFVFKKVCFEVVPVLNAGSASDAQNVTDMSPLHVLYLKKKLGRSQKLRDDIRLAKQFCKAQKVYGAESYINGFSGHVIDLLILHYGGFQELLLAACSWPPKEKLVIDIEGHHKNPLRSLDSAKLHSPIILVDPVQPERNAAAALSRKKYVQFIESAQQFCIHSSKASFQLKRMTKSSVKKLLKDYPQKDYVIVEFICLQGKKDIVGTKCLRAFGYVKKHVSLHGFTIVDSGWEFNEKKNAAISFLVVKKGQLNARYVHVGPPVGAKKAVAAFKNKHLASSNVARTTISGSSSKNRPEGLSADADSLFFVRDGKMCVYQKRQFTTLIECVKHLLSLEQVTSRVNSSEVIE